MLLEESSQNSVCASFGVKENINFSSLFFDLVSQNLPWAVQCTECRARNHRAWLWW